MLGRVDRNRPGQRAPQSQHTDRYRVPSRACLSSTRTVVRVPAAARLQALRETEARAQRDTPFSQR